MFTCINSFYSKAIPNKEQVCSFFSSFSFQDPPVVITIRLEFRFPVSALFLPVGKNVLSNSTGWELDEGGSGDREIFVLCNVFIDDLDNIFSMFSYN